MRYVRMTMSDSRTRSGRAAGAFRPAVLLLSIWSIAGCASDPASRPTTVATPSDGPPARTRLVVEVETEREEWENEKLYLAVFQDPDRFLDRDAWVAGKTVPVTSPVTTVVFEDIPAGPTAISGFIDLVGDANLTRNFIGLPEEPWGFSNDISIFLSKPGFDTAAVELRGPDDRIRFAMGTSLDRSAVRRRRAAAEESE